jgi:uncharacterized protein
VGAAVEAGMAAGRPRQVRVTHLADRITRTAPHRVGESDDSCPAAPPTHHRSVVAFAAGSGLAELFRDAGAEVVGSAEPHSRWQRPDRAAIVDAVRRTGAPEVVVLPNDGETLATATSAVQELRETGLRLAVIPTRAQVQGLAALAVREPDRSFEDDVIAMTNAASQTRHGAVTIARQDAMTTVGPCSVGDTLGIVQGDFAVVGGTIEDCALDVVHRLLSGGGELVTLVTGDGCADDLPDRLSKRLGTARPDVEVAVHDGGQDRYLLLIGVE